MSLTGIRNVVSLLSWVVLLSCSTRAGVDNSHQAGHAPPEQAQKTPPTRSYTVNKEVSDFPPSRDLSTPEAAYATIMRDFMATGASDSEWAEISTWQSDDTERESVSPEWVENCLSAHILEVVIYKNRLALVVAKTKEHGVVGYDRRMLFLDKGRWLNRGRDLLASTIEEARYGFAQECEMRYRSIMKKLGESIEPRWNRQPVVNPESHLRPYVEFLHEQGREPHAFMIEAFKKHKLVVMGEIHHRPTYWAFNTELVRDPVFAQTVGTIYMELPSNHQGNIDKFLTQNTCERDLVVQMLRDFFELGWPCKPTLDFFVAIWDVNQKQPSDKKLCIRLVDMPRPWEKIQKVEDWKAYDVDRDLFMAQNILKDRRNYRGKRHGFFIAGMGHAMEKLYCADQKTPWHSAGWHLRQTLGDQLFTVFQHAPAMTNASVISGRLALGLIDSAFAKLDDRPIVFTLQEGPFGKLPFDGMPDKDAYGTFGDGYDAYLYLIPLEDEIVSPPIEGFYSDEFMPEIDRRWRLMRGKPLFSDIDLPTVERVIKKGAAYWGQPRSWTQYLGPEIVWHSGDAWQTDVCKERHLNVTRQELIKELDKIYRGIGEIDPEKYSPKTWEKAFGFDYMTMTRWDLMYKWWCDVINKHPLESVAYGELTRNKEGLPQIEVTTTLQGGISFSKIFVFKYIALKQKWKTQYGLDLHLDPKWKDLPKAKTISSP